MSHVIDRIAGAPRRRWLVGLAACLLLATAAVAFWRGGDRRSPRSRPTVSAAGHRCTGAATPRARPAADELELATALAQIRKLDEATYEIQRGLLLDLALGRQLRNAVRAVPAMANGKPSGFRVYFVGSHRQPGLLGLRTGDVISTVNGVSLAERERPMGTFRGMIDGRSIELRGTRDGRPLVRTLVLR